MPDVAFQNILAVRLDNVGDVVMLTPALRALRHAAPEARITLLASPAGACVAPLLGEIDDVIERRVPWQDVSGSLPFDPAGELAFIEALRARSFDAAFIFTSFSQSPHAAAYACYLAGIRARFGESKEFGGAVLTVAAPPLPDGAHQVDRNLRLVEAAGVPPAGTALHLRVPPAAAARVAALLARHGLADRGFVVVAPGASCNARRWPAERYAGAAAALARALGLPIVAVGTPAEAAICAVVAAACPHEMGISLAGETCVAEFAAVIESSALVVANNSAAMHIADAFRRPVVALYAGTDAEGQWRPRNSPAVVLRRQTVCTPCYRFDCPYAQECLDIHPQEVVAAAGRLLAAHRPTVHHPQEFASP